MLNYNFILDNLEFLTTDVSLFNLSIIYKERSKVSIIENQNLLNLKRALLSDIGEGRHNLIMFTSEQMEEIKDYLKK